jgi:Sec-independent protein translocase protein TatA
MFDVGFSEISVVLLLVFGIIKPSQLAQLFSQVKDGHQWIQDNCRAFMVSLEREIRILEVDRLKDVETESEHLALLNSWVDDSKD